jgi:hypothetical protein
VSEIDLGDETRGAFEAVRKEVYNHPEIHRADAPPWALVLAVVAAGAHLGEKLDKILEVLSEMEAKQ